MAYCQARPEFDPQTLHTGERTSELHTWPLSGVVEVHSLWQLIIQVPTHQRDNSLMEIILSGKASGTNDSDIQWPCICNFSRVPLYFFPTNCYGYFPTACMFITCIYSIYWTYVSIDGQEDDFSGKPV